MKEEIKDPWCDPENPRIVSFENVSAAAFRIRDGIVRSPCDVSINSFQLNHKIYYLIIGRCGPKLDQVLTNTYKTNFAIFFGVKPSHMTKMTGIDIYLKKDYMQYTGSFKERGARYTLLMLSEEQKKKGVIAASAGNHALALAFHGGQLSKLYFLFTKDVPATSGLNLSKKVEFFK